MSILTAIPFLFRFIDFCINAVTAGCKIIHQKLIPLFVGLCCPLGNKPSSKKSKPIWPNASINNLWQFSVHVQVSSWSQKPFQSK